MANVSRPNKPLLSAIIITKNEERNIYDCLTSLQPCDEVIVLDNDSSDNTVNVARGCGAKVVRTKEWLGYGRQKQTALDLARGQWVLSIDADERLSAELAHEIRRVISSNFNRAYSIERENYFLGKKMRFGGWTRDRVIRLAKRDRCHFSPDLVHESLICEDPTELLGGRLIHFSYQSVDDVFEKQVRYAKLGALKLESAGASSAPPLLKAAWTFTRLYFIQLGFLDGWRGTLSAVAKSYETFWRYALFNKRH